MLADLQYFQVKFRTRNRGLNSKHAQNVLHICWWHYFIVEQHLDPTQCHVDLEDKVENEEQFTK